MMLINMIYSIIKHIKKSYLFYAYLLWRKKKFNSYIVHTKE